MITFRISQSGEVIIDPDSIYYAKNNIIGKVPKIFYSICTNLYCKISRDNE